MRPAKNIVLRLGVVVVLGLLLVACGGSGSTAGESGPITLITATQNPLVANVAVQVPGAGGAASAMVEFGPTTSYGRQTSWFPLTGQLGAGSIYVAGMKASTTYHMRSHVVWNGNTVNWTGTDQTFTTGPIPSNLAIPYLSVSRPNPSLSSMESPGIELINLVDSFPSNVIEALATDRDGNPIWYYDVGIAQGNYPSGFKPLPNGDMVFVLNNSTATYAALLETDLAGHTVHAMTIPQLQQKMLNAGFSTLPDGISHDVLALDNGHTVWITTTNKQFTDLPGYPGTITVAGDGLVDLDENWNPVWAWSSFDHLDINRHLAGLPDWTHANAVVYSPSDGNILFSLRHQAWILKIDYANGAGTGDVLWRLGNQGDFTLTNGDASQWFFFQHYPSLISQNNGQTSFAVIDNGNDRVPENSSTLPCTPVGGPGCYSRATIFQIDEVTKTATLDWADVPGYFSLWGGSINQMANGNVEFDMTAPQPSPAAGVNSQVREVTSGTTPQTVWQMDIGKGSAYRAYRIPSLYPGVAWSQ